MFYEICNRVSQYYECCTIPTALNIFQSLFVFKFKGINSLFDYIVLCSYCTIIALKTDIYYHF